MKFLFMRFWLLVFLILLSGCSRSLQPARPSQFLRLHARITEVELRMTRDDSWRRNQLQETARQTREIDAIATERFTFSNAVARAWAEVHQEIDTMEGALDLAVQGIDYLEKSVDFQRMKLADSWKEFQKNYNTHFNDLLRVVCVRKPENPRCAAVGSTQEKTP